MPDPTAQPSEDSATRAVLVNRLPANALAAKFEHNLAVVIGINRYRHVRQLKTARPDAERLAALLQKQDRDIHDWYEVVTFYDEQAECTALREYLSTTLPARVREAGEEAAVSTRVLFYFAGHGDAEDGDAGLKGYLFPQDAQPEVEASLLDMAWVQEQLTNLPCRHVLIILDCCSAGALPKQASTRSALRPAPLYWDYLERYVGGKARQVITSAAHNQQALDIPNYKAGERDTGEDHSPFAQALFEALDPAFAGGSQIRPAGRYGVVTTTDLYQYVSDALHRRVGDRQTPGLWTLYTHEQGEYVFLLPGTRLQLDPAPDLTKREYNPWPHASTDGLQQAGLFAGRDREIEELAELVAAHPLVAVTGSSAVGKSSLVQAGLLPWLVEEAVRQPDEPGISWQTLPPLTLDAQAPLQTLIKHINQTLGQSSESELEVAPAVVWAHSGTGQRLLLALDLTEALFEPAAQAELSALVNWLEQAKQMGGLHVVLTLRSDHWFMPGAGAGSERKQLLPSAIRYELSLMNRDGLRQVIERPAAARMIYLSPPELIAKLVEAVEGEREPAALPLLSAILHRMYLRYADEVTCGKRKSDRTLTLDDYNDKEVGGVEGVIKKLAECFHRKLPADAAYVTTLQHVLLRLVDVEEGRYKRRCAWREEFDFPDVAATARARAVIDGLTACGLVVQGADALGQAYVELGHRDLVQAWPLLGDCLREKSEAWAMLRALAAQVRDWLPGRHKADLWHDDPRLPQLEEMLWPVGGRFGWAWRVLAPARGVPPDTEWLNSAELAFVQKSIQARAGFWRRVVGAAMLLLLVLVTATVVSLGLRDRAVKAEAAAVADATRALNAESTAIAEATRALNAESTAVAEATRALNAEATALVNEEIASRKQAEAEREARRAWAGVLAGRGQADIRENKNANDTGILLARAALLTTLYGDGYYTRNAVETLDLARANVHWRRTFLPKGVRHRGPIKAVVYSPDGTRLLSGGRDATLIVWDATTMEPLHTLQGHADSVLAVAWNPDGTRIVSGGADNTLIVWDVETLSPIRILRGHSGPVNSVAWSPNGKKIASGSADGTLVIWDATEMTPPTTLSDHTDAVTSVAWSPEGTRIVSGSQDDTLILWNAETLAQVQRLEGHSGDVRSAAWSPDGSRIVSGSDDGTLIVWDASGLKLGQSIASKPITSVAWASTGIHIVSGSSSGTLIQWDARMLRPEQILDGHNDWIDSVAWSPDGTHIALSTLTGMPTVRTATTLTAVHTGPGHSLFVKSAAWSPDGGKIASGSEDGTVVVWDAATLEPGSLMSGHRGAVNSMAWSPDGTRLASGSTDKMVVIWDVTTLEIVVTLSGHSDGVNSVAWSPDGTRIVSGGEDGMLIIWDAVTLVRGQIARSENAIRAVAWSPDGTRIVSGSFDRTVMVWDAAALTPLHPPMTGHTQIVTSVAWSPDGARIVSGSADNKLILWDATNLTPVRTLVGHRDWVSSVVWSSDSSRIVSGSIDRTLIIWDAVAGDPLQTLQGHSGYVTTVAVSPDSKRMVSGSADYSLIVWDDTTLPATKDLLWHRDDVTCVAWSPNGDRILSGSVDTTLIVWDVKTLSWIRILHGHDGAVTTLAWSPDASHVVSGSWDGTLIVWDARSWTQGRPLSGHKGVITTVAWSPDGTRFVSGGQDHTLIVWDAVAQNPKQILHEHSDEVTSVAWSPDGQRIVSASKDGTLIVWDASTLAPVQSLQDRNGSVLSLAWSPDGALFVSGGTGNILTVWDAMTLVPTQTLRGHRGHIYAVAWSPDGTRIVSGSGQRNVWQTPDNTLIVWDVATWMPLGTLEGHSEPVSSVTWSPDGRQIASGSADQTLKVWPVTDGVLALIETQILRPSWAFTMQERVEYGIPNALADWLASIPPLPMYTPTQTTEPLVGPAPTATLTPQVMGIAITEIMYDPPPDPEFIEVTNLGAVSVDLSGAIFTGITFTFPDGTMLHPGESLVVVRDLAAFVAGHPEAKPTGVFTGKLANEGERITLRRANGEILASVHYGVSGDWPIPGDQRGSLVLVDPNGDPDDPINWRLSTQATGSPGRYPD